MINDARQSVRARTVSYLSHGDATLAIQYLLNRVYRSDDSFSRDLAVELLTGLVQVSTVARVAAHTGLKAILMEIYEAAVSSRLAPRGYSNKYREKFIALLNLISMTNIQGVEELLSSVLVAECRSGLGEKSYYYILKAYSTFRTPISLTILLDIAQEKDLRPYLLELPASDRDMKGFYEDIFNYDVHTGFNLMLLPYGRSIVPQLELAIKNVNRPCLKEELESNLHNLKNLTDINLDYSECIKTSIANGQKIQNRAKFYPGSIDLDEVERQQSLRTIRGLLSEHPFIPASEHWI